MYRKILITLAFFPALAFGDSLICEGKITRIGNHAPGGLYLQLDTMPMVEICSFNEQQFRHSPEDCKHIASLAQQAIATDIEVRVYIDNTFASSCSTIPAWSAVDLRVFSFEK